MYFQEDQRKQIENKLEEKAKEEKEEIIQERRQLFQERRQTQAKLQKIEQKIEIVETVSWFFIQNIKIDRQTTYQKCNKYMVDHNYRGLF